MDASCVFISRLYSMLYEQSRNNKLSYRKEKHQEIKMLLKINQIFSARKNKLKKNDTCNATFR